MRLNSTRFSPPPDYDCPFCKVAQGIGDAITPPADIVYHDEHTSAFISPRWWPNNRGYAVVIPNPHYQDIFDLPPDMAAHIHRTAQKIALAYAELYDCDGVSTRQHNGTYPLQEVGHYHFHVFPRYQDDQLYALDHACFRPLPAERIAYAEKLRAFLAAL